MQEAPVPFVTRINNLQPFASIFSMVEVYISNQEKYNSNGMYAYKSYIPKNFKGAISEYKGVCIVRVTAIKNFPTTI